MAANQSAFYANAIRTGFDGQDNLPTGVTATLEYDRGTPDTIKISVRDILRGAPSDALSLSTFDFNGAAASTTEPSVSPQLAATTAPGALAGSNQIVSAATTACEVGSLYLLSYTIDAGSAFTAVFPGGTSPFPPPTDPYPTEVGTHHLLVECDATDTTAIMRTNGPGTISDFSLRKAEWNYNVPASSAGNSIQFTVTHGESTFSAFSFVPTASEIYVSTSGSDFTGTGAISSPYYSPAHAATKVQPGDTVYLRPGVYSPFSIATAGTSGNVITFTTMPGEEHEAIIRGDLMQHEFYGGDGVNDLEDNEYFRDGIRVEGVSYITISNLTVKEFWRNGIFVIGNGVGTITEQIIIDNCKTENTGLSGIYVCGDRSDSPVPANDPFRTRNVTIRNNNITKTNVITDYNNNTTNPQGEPGGVGEAITVANSVQFVDTYDNTLYDSRQYGIDYKNHVVDGSIYGNTISGFERYGIYIDAGELDVRRIDVYNNRIDNCGYGITLAREEDGNDSGDDLILEDIDIYNNVISDIDDIGLYLQKHPKDGQDIGLYQNIRLRFNSLYNTNRSGETRDINIDDISAFGNNLASTPIVAGIELIGNIIWNPDGSHNCRTDVASDGRFTVSDNFNVVNGTSNGTNPRYANPEGGNFNLLSTSAAVDSVVGQSASPFDTDYDGNARPATANAGAFE